MVELGDNFVDGVSAIVFSGCPLLDVSFLEFSESLNLIKAPSFSVCAATGMKS